MTRTDQHFGPTDAGFGTALRDEGFSLLVGVGFTLVLFLGLAQMEHRGAAQPTAQIEDLHSYSLPMDAPPPPVPQEIPEAAPVAITGIEVAAAPDSAVRIAVSVPLLENLPVPVAPRARIQASPFDADFKPKLNLADDLQRIFQQSEVDQRPAVLVNTNPNIPAIVRRRASLLRVVVLMVVDAGGAVTSVRVLNTSGNDEFDAIVSKCVQDEWVFSPAVRKGKKVRCLVQRAISVRWTSSPFDN